MKVRHTDQPLFQGGNKEAEKKENFLPAAQVSTTECYLCINLQQCVSPLFPTRILNWNFEEVLFEILLECMITYLFLFLFSKNVLTNVCRQAQKRI